MSIHERLIQARVSMLALADELQRLDVHLVLDNYGTHKHPNVRQVELWFGLITQRAIRRGSFRTVRDLVERIDIFVTRYNQTAAPFVWTATAESILAKVARIAPAISGTSH